MKAKNLLLPVLLSCVPFVTNAQTTSETPKGKAIVQVFGNFHSGFGSERNNRGFELDRSYLGYEYQAKNSLTVKGVMDIGQSNDVNDYHRIAYIKNALITWHTGDLKISGGLISTIQFNMQEKFWGYRYVAKSFQDMYKFGSSADLGISASYKFADWLSADAIIANGEGYKKIQKNDGLLYGLGTTISPIKGLSIRLYSGINENTDKGAKDIVNYATFIGYHNNQFSIAAEYNIMQNNGSEDDADLYGLSVYGSIKLNKQSEIFARFDQLSSKDDWNEEKDESAIVAGAQFNLGKNIKIAPNFRVNIPKSSDIDEKYMGYISCYFGL